MSPPRSPRGSMPRRAPGLALALAACLSLPGAARAGELLAAGDSAWAQGDHPRAESCYRRALAEDPGAARAAFRLGLLASWSDRLDTALVWIRRARALEPVDPEMRIAEARVLAWQDQSGAAVALYDSVLVADPQSYDAALGRAQALSWAGRLGAADSAYVDLLGKHPRDEAAALGRADVASWRGDRSAAERLYTELLARAPRNAGALVGLARLHLAEGRSGQARREVAQVLAADSSHRQALALGRQIAVSLRPRLTAGSTWSDDSDRNEAWSQTASSSLWLASGLWGFASASAVEAHDPMRRSIRRGGEAGITWAFGPRQLTAAAGAGEFRPRGLGSRVHGTARAVLTHRIRPSVSVSLDASHQVLDDTALLIERQLGVDALGFGFEAPLPRGARLGGGAATASFGDGNRRWSWLASGERDLPLGLGVAVLARQLAYRRHGAGYFSPDQFTLAEARASAAWSRRALSARAQGGIGGQQTSLAATGQLEWHYELRLGWTWSDRAELETFFGASNSAVSSSSGAYRWRSAGLSLRLGL